MRFSYLRRISEVSEVDILFLPLQSQFVSFNVDVLMLIQEKKKKRLNLENKALSISDLSNRAEKYIKIMSYTLLI